MVRYLLLSLLVGCAPTKGEILIYDDGVEFKANRPCIMEYKKDDLTLKFDSKGQSLINLPAIDLDIEK